MKPHFSQIDLHTHSSASDGSLSPRELVRCAAVEGVTTLAVCDHNTVLGVAEAKDEGVKLNVEVVAGVELSMGERAEWHLLGLFVDAAAPSLKAAEEKLCAARRERHAGILDRLSALNITLSADDILMGNIPSRVHIARALVKAGVVKSVDLAFSKLLTPGRPAFVELKRISAREAVDAVLGAGGVAAIAHPLRHARLDGRMLDHLTLLREMGMRAVECHHPAHTPADALALERFCEREGLLVTGGSDFHGDLGATPGDTGSRWPLAAAHLSALRQEAFAQHHTMEESS